MSRAHHPDSPSSLQASEACPCFENEQRESLAATAGTRQHAAVETGDLSGLDDEAEIAAVKRCLAYEKQVRDWFKAEYGTEPLDVREIYLSVGDDRVKLEEREWIGITGGFPDLVLYSLAARVAHILDWKFGNEPVTETKDNLQGWAYALGVFKAYPRVNEVTVHFYAPNQGWSEEEHNEKYIATFTRADIPRMELRIRTVIARKKSANAKPNPRTDLCLWCAKKGDCPALANTVIAISPKYGEFVVPDVVDPLAPMVPEQRAVLYKFADQVQNWAKEVKSRQTKQVLEEGIDIPGYSLVKRQERTVESVPLVKAAALKNGMTPDEWDASLTVSITKIENAVKAKAARGEGAAVVRQLASDLEESGAVGKADPTYFLKEGKTPVTRTKRVEPVAVVEPTTSGGYLT